MNYIKEKNGFYDLKLESIIIEILDFATKQKEKNDGLPFSLKHSSMKSLT